MCPIIYVLRADLTPGTAAGWPGSLSPVGRAHSKLTARYIYFLKGKTRFKNTNKSLQMINELFTGFDMSYGNEDMQEWETKNS